MSKTWTVVVLFFASVLISFDSAVHAQNILERIEPLPSESENQYVPSLISSERVEEVLPNEASSSQGEEVYPQEEGPIFLGEPYPVGAYYPPAPLAYPFAPLPGPVYVGRGRMVSYGPVVATTPGYYIGAGPIYYPPKKIVIRQKIYPPKQPMRNMFRAISPY